jgi:hypothetical protein
MMVHVTRANYVGHRISASCASPDVQEYSSQLIPKKYEVTEQRWIVRQRFDAHHDRSVVNAVTKDWGLGKVYKRPDPN